MVFCYSLLLDPDGVRKGPGKGHTHSIAIFPQGMQHMEYMLYFVGSIHNASTFQNNIKKIWIG